MDVYNLKRISPSPGHEQYLDVGTFETSEESSTESLSMISRGVSSKSAVFTFVPVMEKLPIKSIVTEAERIGPLTSKLNENLTAAEEKASEETMSDDEGIFKAEVVYIKDSEEDGAGNAVKRTVTDVKLKRPADHVTLPQTPPSVFSVQAENTTHQNNTSHRFVASPASMETAVNKHRDSITQQQRHSLSPSASECGSGFLVNRASASEDRTSPTDSMDLFPTPASSRESILSDGWDKERWWSTNEASSPVSVSRAVSPCSSVRSGMFSPAVVRVTRHSLAPGSSMLHMPSTCFSSCESLSSSSVWPPQSPPPPSRRRPPLTRLSLLTAILRKGRLPILSPALQRPYSPCWPINLVSLSSCNACSAASSLASIPLEVSSSSTRAPSSSAQATDKHLKTQHHRDRCVTAPAPEYLKGLYSSNPLITRHSGPVDSNARPKWERVISPSPPAPSQNRFKPANNGDVTLPQQVLLPRLYSPITGLKPLSVHHPVDPNENDKALLSKVQLPHSSASSFKSESPDFKPSSSHVDLKNRKRDYTPLSSFSKLRSQSPKPIKRQEISAPRERSPQLQHSSRSRPNSLSPKPSALPCCLTETRPSIFRSLPSVTVSPVKRYTDTTSPPPLQNSAKERWQSEQAPLASDGTSPSPAKAHCLSPSRYMPIVFPGWPSPTHSPPSTPDHFTLSPSPATLLRDLSPSPSLSVRSTPSPRPWIDISDCIDREGKARKQHKIKLSYKSLAAIPTNTLLLDQQAIDDQVERDLHDTLELDKDTHAEMCSPAQLRQQSEELYAVIDEILEDSIPKCRTSRAPQPSREPANKVPPQLNRSPPRSLGRETKYATCSLTPPTPVERKLMDSYKTKPGVIRPLSATPRLTVEDSDGEYHANPFRQYLELSVVDKQKSSHPIVTIHENEALKSNKLESMSLVESWGDAGGNPEGQPLSKEKRPETANTFSMSTLLITEPENRNTL